MDSLQKLDIKLLEGTSLFGHLPDFITFLRHHIAHNDNQRVT